MLHRCPTTLYFSGCGLDIMGNIAAVDSLQKALGVPRLLAHGTEGMRFCGEAITKKNRVIGVSGGAVVAVMLCMGMDAGKMRDIVQGTVTEDMVVPSLAQLVKEGHLSTWEGVQSGLAKHLLHQTLGELEKDTGGLRLSILTTAMQSMELVELTPESHPDLPFLEALRASTCIPMVFPPVVTSIPVAQSVHFLDGEMGIDKANALVERLLPEPSSCMVIRCKRASQDVDPTNALQMLQHLVTNRMDATEAVLNYVLQKGGVGVVVPLLTPTPLDLPDPAHYPSYRVATDFQVGLWVRGMS